jgi:hypothetical protein
VASSALRETFKARALSSISSNNSSGSEIAVFMRVSMTGITRQGNDDGSHASSANRNRRPLDAT